MICDSCSRDTGDRTYIVEGVIRTHVQCSFCHDGIPRPPEPLLIHETFGDTHTRRLDRILGADKLDSILDKLIGAER